MPMKVLDATISTFEGVLEKFRSEGASSKANLILFLADKVPSTNLNCVRAEPAVIYKKLEASSDNVMLLKAYVGDWPTWRNPRHPWRTDSRFKLKGVPTLIRWEDDAIYVGDWPTWRNPRHPWRTDSRFKLKGVPTLIRWEDDAIKARIDTLLGVSN